MGCINMPGLRHSVVHATIRETWCRAPSYKRQASVQAAAICHLCIKLQASLKHAKRVSGEKQAAAHNNRKENMIRTDRPKDIDVYYKITSWASSSFKVKTWAKLNPVHGWFESFINFQGASGKHPIKPQAASIKLQATSCKPRAASSLIFFPS
jgi:hypothetical protein